MFLRLLTLTFFRENANATEPEISRNTKLKQKIASKHAQQEIKEQSDNSNIEEHIFDNIKKIIEEQESKIIQQKQREQKEKNTWRQKVEAANLSKVRTNQKTREIDEAYQQRLEEAETNRIQEQERNDTQRQEILANLVQIRKKNHEEYLARRTANNAAKEIAVKSACCKR